MVEVEQRQMVGGKIVIEADPVTGAMSVNAPSNLIIAFGMLETAKMILTQQNMANQAAAAARKPILPASAADLSKLPPVGRPQ